MTRKQRPEPRAFKEFPEEQTCPVCRTNDEGQCVLVPIDGTEDDGICEAQCVHLSCCIPTHYRREAGLLYLRIELAPASQPDITC